MKIHVISASRRTDIPAFYGAWFMNRIRAGWCAVPNPFNAKQISRIEFEPKSTLLVFWTRWAEPFIKNIPELESMGYRFYFQYTVMDNPQAIDPKSPPLDKAVASFCHLADRIGPERVIWRYDPVLLSRKTDHRFHIDRFSHIASRLQNSTRRVIVSIVDSYDKAQSRLKKLAKENPEFECHPFQPERDLEMMKKIARVAQDHGLEIQSCAEEIDLQSANIQPGKCVDDGLIAKLFGADIDHQKDKGQRKACGCIESREIGMYDSCLFGCVYCYATRNFKAAKNNHSLHDPESESLLGHYCAPQTKGKIPALKTKKPSQLDLFD